MRWVFLATDNIASLTNAHHGRPVFFNLQVDQVQSQMATVEDGLAAIGMNKE
jgi:hypothetical protein